MKALVVSVPAGEVELASDALWALGVVAVEERDAGGGTEDHLVELWTSLGDDVEAVTRAAEAFPVRWRWQLVDVDESVAFYRDVLGFSKVVGFPGAAFMRAAGSTNDHDLGLFQIGPGAARPDRRTTGLYHLAWQVDTIEELAALRTKLVEAKSLVGQSDHGVSKSLYAVDPSGIEFEVMWAVPREDWPQDVGTWPLDLDAALARWPGVDTSNVA